MRLSTAFFHTRKEDPHAASCVSHKLFLRADFLQQVTAGIYCYSPMLWRVIRKVEQIVREEMDRTGALELNLPILQPKALWDETKRWNVYREAGILFHLTDRKGEELCLAPTAEEVITDYVRARLKSYRDLPVNLYQIDRKFRDEIRPQFGPIRGREFLMKDAYSFDRSEAGMQLSYEQMKQAYIKVCERCGLKYRMVEADSGAIGGAASAEFMVLADTGEDTILECDTCDYGANLEKAEAIIASDPQEQLKPLERRPTPNIRTVDQLSEFFQGLPARKMVKTIIYQVSKGDKTEVVAVCIRGDLVINEVKLTNYLKANSVATADDETVQAATKAEVGFAGPVGLENVRIIADKSVEPMTNFLCGGNQTDVHLLNVNYGRDFPQPVFVDLKQARAGDRCPRCSQGILKVTRGIEMGHIFQLGTKYSEAMGLTFLDESGKKQIVWMGCYGIGISRIAAAAIEQWHDDDGMIWPASIAPYQVIIVPVSWQDEFQRNLAEELYKKFQQAGVEVMLDDRPEGSAGFKFKDADLLGIPWRIIVGKKAKAGIVELRGRKDKVTQELTVSEILSRYKAT